MSVKLLAELRSNIVTFLDELIDQFPSEGDLILARIFLKDQVPITDIMNAFITKALPVREKVKARDESFFLENNVLFERLDTGKVSYFKTLWTKLDDENRQIVWRWFDLFISIVDRYQKSCA